MNSFSESRASVLLDLILRGEVRELVPVYDPVRGYEYCSQLRKLGVEDCDDAMMIIRELVDTGVLRMEIHDRVAACSKCGSSSFIVRTKCPYCGSLEFKRGIVIEHLTCGFIGFEGEFLIYGERILCPKCRRELKLGKDSLKVADLYKCGNCGEVFSIPSFSHECLNCGYENKEVELKPKEIYKYVLVPESLMRDPLIALKEIIRDEIAERGFEVLGPRVKLRGTSGAEFEFDLVIKGPDGSNLIAIDYFSSLDREKLIAAFAKAHETDVRRILILHGGEVREPDLDYAKRLNLEILKLDSAQETAKKILEILRKELE